MSFEPLKKIISRSAGNFVFSKELQVAQVFNALVTVLENLWGRERSAYLSPVSFREGSLKIQSASPAAMQLFRLEETRIKNEINRKLGGKVVTTIKVMGKGF